MREFRRFLDVMTGVERPLTGCLAPVWLLGLLTVLSTGCSSQSHQESLPTVQVGMSCTRTGDGCESNVPAIYDDGEMQIYEVKKGLQFPILAPTDRTQGELNAIAMDPYGRRPWITTDDVEVQVSWTLSNLDDEEHVVEMLVDPWNEFGRYYPGLQLTDAEEEAYMPNFSGIDKRYIVGPASSGEGSRVHGTYTYADLEEVATDFATVMSMLQDPPTSDDPEEDPTVTYTNHAFAWQNRSYNDGLIKSWVPATVAGLTGLDLGFRTYEPVNVAIEVEVEVVDKSSGQDRVRQEGQEDKPLLEPSDEIITVGVVPP